MLVSGFGKKSERVYYDNRKNFPEWKIRQNPRMIAKRWDATVADAFITLRTRVARFIAPKSATDAFASMAEPFESATDPFEAIADAFEPATNSLESGVDAFEAIADTFEPAADACGAMADSFELAIEESVKETLATSACDAQCWVIEHPPSRAIRGLA